MVGKLVAVLFLVFTLLVVAETASGVVSVGVKKGDWIEYGVSFTGTPPEGHEVSWARMEVLDVQGAEISLNITTETPEGLVSSETIMLNLETGEIGDDFVIPADLRDGDVFYDMNFGNITVESVEVRVYAGSTRVVVVGGKSENLDYWDQLTGFLLEGISSFPDYTMTARVERTNLWQSQQTGLDPAALVLVVLVAVIVLATAVLVVRRRLRRKGGA